MKKALIVVSIIIVVVAVGIIAYLAFSPSATVTKEPIIVAPPPPVSPVNSSEEPDLSFETVANGLNNPWDVTFIDSDTFFYPERNGAIHLNNAGVDTVIERADDIYVEGEGGLMGMVVDVDFDSNHFLYTCMNVRNGNQVSVSLVRWVVSDDLTTLLSRKDIVTNMPSNGSGRHSGCRVTMAQDGLLWVGTGDTAVGTLPQDPKSLGGKVLRVNRDGEGVTGNLEAPFDNRIFNYGHRNIQGIYYRILCLIEPIQT